MEVTFLIQQEITDFLGDKLIKKLCHQCETYAIKESYWIFFGALVAKGSDFQRRLTISKTHAESNEIRIGLSKIANAYYQPITHYEIRKF